MSEINHEAVRQWVKALRSGHYPQTAQTLRDGLGFCCLGVACDLYDPNGWAPVSIAGGPNDQCAFGDDEMLLHDDVARWLGVGDRSPAVSLSLLTEQDHEHLSTRDKTHYEDILTKGRIHLTDLNDAGFSFNRIADLIEQEFLQ